METHLSAELQGTPEGIEAESILRKCVHCGFCTATCPTYQLLGDELDGPRGRIYLIKQVVEGVEPTRATQEHLDRCLTCRNCESTCPSGVQYGRLVDIGRQLVDAKVERPFAERVTRQALKSGLTTRALFEPAMAIGKALKPVVDAVLSKTLADKVPVSRPRGLIPNNQHARKVLMLNGCVQPGMLPSIDAATIRVLDKLGIQALIEHRSGCCGAIKHHLNDHVGSFADIKRNIDAWWPHLESVEALVMNASGCGAMVKDYAHLLRNDAHYAEKAKVVSEKCIDLSQYLASQRDEIAKLVKKENSAAVAAYHPPCTLQHGQQIRGHAEEILQACGVQLAAVGDAHLCCGSAGTYSVTQPVLSKQLRDRKLANLEQQSPGVILSSNIGCITHLQSGTQKPVLHWIEWIDQLSAT